MWLTGYYLKLLHTFNQLRPAELNVLSPPAAALPRPCLSSPPSFSCGLFLKGGVIPDTEETVEERDYKEYVLLHKCIM